MDKEWKYRLVEERIINFKENEKLSPLIKCPICLNILWKPVSCSLCQQKFCDFCLSDYIQNQYTKNPKCPFRCINFNKNKPDILLFQILNMFSFYCFYNSKGCKTIISYENIEKHENECEFSEKLCENCKNKFCLGEMKNHYLICKMTNEKLSAPQVFSDIYKSSLIEILNENKTIEINKYNKLFHVAFGNKEMTNGIHKWKIFFRSGNDIGLGLVAGLAEMKDEPKIFTFARYVDIYQEYYIHACTVWNQIWRGSINDITNAFQSNKWDNKWFHYELNFEKETFVIKCPDENFHSFKIQKGKIYRIYNEICYIGNQFTLELDE